MHHYDVNLHLHPLIGPGYEPIQDDPVFDPARHLALEKPASTLSLTDLGYGEEIAATTPTQVAATSCFRVLSDEGVETMLHVCKQLEAFTTSNPRVARNTRGGVYRSKFLRDFSMCPEYIEHLSGIMETPLLPLAMGHQIAHLNYQPLTVGKNIDKWHYDTLQVDTVMFVTDPKSVEGGEFQYFKGTRKEMGEIYASGKSFPHNRIESPDMPGPGYSVLMQGNYVVHQAKGLRKEGERITLVNGFSYADQHIPDYTALGQLFHADPPNIASAEYARHIALRCSRQLEQFINEPRFSDSPKKHAQGLSLVQTELNKAIEQLNNADGEEMRHFGES
ncbi:MAG: hypothetical protein GKR96_00090 [Gammaproteobacteria bacterium]|nr:hypothetical protein [Gammaproteobacteria bacterium]